MYPRDKRPGGWVKGGSKGSPEWSATSAPIFDLFKFKSLRTRWQIISMLSTSWLESRCRRRRQRDPLKGLRFMRGCFHFVLLPNAPLPANPPLSHTNWALHINWIKCAISAGLAKLSSLPQSYLPPLLCSLLKKKEGKNVFWWVPYRFLPSVRNFWPKKNLTRTSAGMFDVREREWRDKKKPIWFKKSQGLSPVSYFKSVWGCVGELVWEWHTHTHLSGKWTWATCDLIGKASGKPLAPFFFSSPATSPLTGENCVVSPCFWGQTLEVLRWWRVTGNSWENQGSNMGRKFFTWAGAWLVGRKS